jgi:carbon-monoxide dehydrogenase medium subunit
LIPAAFTYRRAWSVDEALDLAAQGGDEAKFLAGGHSLLPLMKLRLAVPEILVDIGRLQEFSYIRDDGSEIAVGALTSHHDLAQSGLLRHRGTIGGSLAHADPAADLPAVILALDARLVATTRSGSRRIGAAEFFRGLFETALEPGELLTEIRIPKPQAAGWSFQKFTKRAIDWAIVGVAVQGGHVALINMGQKPLRASAVERALADGAGPRDAAFHAADGTSPPDDINADRGYREHLARVLVARALGESRALDESRARR